MQSFDPEAFQRALTLLDEKVKILVLVTGTLIDGTSHYAYASIPLSRYKPFKIAEEKGDYNLAEYGTILTHGDGLTPPDDVKAKLEQEHGANHLFEAQLEQLVKDAQHKANQP